MKNAPPRKYYVRTVPSLPPSKKRRLQSDLAWDKMKDPTGYNGSAAARFWYWDPPMTSEQKMEIEIDRKLGKMQSSFRRYWKPPTDLLEPVSCHCWKGEPFSCKKLLRELVDGIVASVKEVALPGKGVVVDEL